MNSTPRSARIGRLDCSRQTRHETHAPSHSHRRRALRRGRDHRLRENDRTGLVHGRCARGLGARRAVRGDRHAQGGRRHPERHAGQRPHAVVQEGRLRRHGVVAQAARRRDRQAARLPPLEQEDEARDGRRRRPRGAQRLPRARRRLEQAHARRLRQHRHRPARLSEPPEHRHVQEERALPSRSRRARSGSRARRRPSSIPATSRR